MDRYSTFLTRLTRQKGIGRYATILVTHSALAAVSNALAFWLRFEGRIPAHEAELLLRTLPVLITLRAAAFLVFRLHQEVWAYTGLSEVRAISKGVVFSTLAFAAALHVLIPGAGYPRSVFVIDSLLLICLIVGVQLSGSMLKELTHKRPVNRVLIWGAGDTGEMLVRDMKSNPHYRYDPVGFVDDNPEKTGWRIHGVPVLGARDTLAGIVGRARPDEIILAMSQVDAATVRGIVEALAPFDMPLRSIPSMREIVNGTVGLGQVHELSVEDLLPRARFGLDREVIGELIKGRRVLVTGAGGSIGSEMCRQIAGLQPDALVLFDHYENSLHALGHELAATPASSVVHAVVGDITDRRRLDQVLDRYAPHIVLHAAAHKHVPLMETNPCEAVKNNVRGTRLVAEAAAAHGIERFTMISTDKAVNPSSVMGATKRVAERIVQGIARRPGTTVFTIVRFGNVLGSNGSVVPRFIEQIKAGGPVTVTDPRIRRYFMLIPEAVHLVLHAAARGDNGAIYVLEMGEQVPLVELARTMIRLSGFVPERDIAITFVGLRPGEKLSEELVGGDEVATASPMPDIVKVTSRLAPGLPLASESALGLEMMADAGDPDAVIGELGRLVPTFQPAPRRRAA
jgi:FlaA1/EpsC-like NDP-sugar epimerase